MKLAIFICTILIPISEKKLKHNPFLYQSMHCDTKGLILQPTSAACSRTWSIDLPSVKRYVHVTTGVLKQLFKTKQRQIKLKLGFAIT